MTEQEILATQPKAKASFAMSGKVAEKAEKWSKKYKVATDYVMTLFISNMNTMGDERKALLATLGDLQNESGREAFYTYVLNDEGPFDMFERMRAKVTRMLEGKQEDHDKAIEDNMAFEDGTVLDYRKTIFGRPNENEGAPLTGNDWQRRILALVADNEEFNDAQVVEIKSTGEAAKDMPIIENFTYYKAFINQNRNHAERFSFGKNSAFKKISPVVSNAEVINKIDCIAIAELEKTYKEKFAGKKYVDYLAPVRGYVTWMSLDVIKGARILRITDPDTEESVRCRLPESIKVVYQRADEVIAWLRLYAGRDGKIGAEAKAYMVI